jgi:hypothetical protein
VDHRTGGDGGNLRRGSADEGRLEAAHQVAAAITDVDEEVHNSLKSTLDNPLTDTVMMFVASFSEGGEYREVELKDGGASIAVTDKHKQEYVDHMTEYALTGKVKDELAAFAVGFWG